MAHTTLVANIKGGVGKTTLATNLAVAHSLRKRRVLLVDTDPQGSAERWSILRGEQHPDRRAVPCVSKRGSLHLALPSMADSYDSVIVDSGGRDVAELRSSMLVAQLLVVPVVPALFDLWATEQLLHVAQAAAGANPTLEVLAVLVRSPTHPLESESATATAYLTQLGLAVADTRLRERLVYRRAAESGLGVQEVPKSGPARREVAALYEELYG